MLAPIRRSVAPSGYRNGETNLFPGQTFNTTSTEAVGISPVRGYERFLVLPQSCRIKDFVLLQIVMKVGDSLFHERLEFR